LSGGADLALASREGGVESPLSEPTPCSLSARVV
jgi:hypothetical protein